MRGNAGQSGIYDRHAALQSSLLFFIFAHITISPDVDRNSSEGEVDMVFPALHDKFPGSCHLDLQTFEVQHRTRASE